MVENIELTYNYAIIIQEMKYYKLVHFCYTTVFQKLTVELMVLNLNLLKIYKSNNEHRI